MALVRIMEFSGDATGGDGHGYANRAQLELDALPPVGTSVFLLDDQLESAEYTVHEVHLIVHNNQHHFAVMVAPLGQPYRKTEGVASPPWNPEQKFMMQSQS